MVTTTVRSGVRVVQFHRKGETRSTCDLTVAAQATMVTKSTATLGLCLLIRSCRGQGPVCMYVQ